MNDEHRLATLLNTAPDEAMQDRFGLMYAQTVQIDVILNGVATLVRKPRVTRA